MKSLAEEFALAYRRVTSQPVKYRTAERDDAKREKTGQGGNDSDASPDESRGQWKTVGGAPAFVGHDGSILAACPGLEDEHVDDITDESDESRDRRERKRRERKMDAAEDAGHESNEQKEARGGWQQARDELGDDGSDTLAFLKIGDSYYSFGDDAKTILEATGAGDGESCQIKEGGIQQHLTQLTEAGHRVAIAERDEDGNSEIERTAEPESSDDDGFDFPWETDGEDIPEDSATADVDDAADESKPDVLANDSVRTPERATKDRPGRVEIKGKAFDVYQDDASGFWFFQTAGRRDIGWTIAAKETRTWLDDQHGSGAMEFPSGSDPRKPTQAAKPNASEAPPLADKASPKPPKPPKKLSRFDQAIIDAVGDDPDDVRGFRELVLDVYARKQREAVDQNHAYTNLLGQFGVTGAKQGAFIRTIQKLHDPDGIRRFDEMVEMAQRDYPELLEYGQGSHVASEDAEYALFQRLQRGLVAMPAKWSPEVIDEALDFVSAAERSPVSRLHDNTDWSQVEFSRRRRLFWEAVVKYSVQTWDESKHPRGNPENAGEFSSTNSNRDDMNEKQRQPLINIPATWDEANALAWAAREHQFGDTRAENGDCIGAAMQIAGLRPDGEIWSGEYLGDGVDKEIGGHHVIAKIGKYFIDITHDQFDGQEDDPVVVMEKHQLESEGYGAFKRSMGLESQISFQNTGIVKSLADYEDAGTMLNGNQP